MPACWMWRSRDDRGEEDSKEGCGYTRRRSPSPCLTALLFGLSAHKWDQESEKTGGISQAWLKLSKVFKFVPRSNFSLFSYKLGVDVLMWRRTIGAAAVIWA